ncbi:MAG: hypothetical protein D8M59_12760 [Planctomycetes bacterium]|nr:hypothetical protein [Planctomycetota bacterium]NOG53688.1 hypothetical protein [Planctomycetota bacterium]
MLRLGPDRDITLDGRGGSSYIDSVILRDKDANSGWTSRPCAASYDVRGDVDRDADVDSTDKSIAQSNYQGTTSGFNDLTAIGNRKGYAGYEWDGVVSMLHVRNRVLHAVLGRWTRRDPLGYVDGMNVYEYVGGMTLSLLDPMGTKIPPDWERRNSERDIKRAFPCDPRGVKFRRRKGPPPGEHETSPSNPTPTPGGPPWRIITPPGPLCEGDNLHYDINQEPCDEVKRLAKLREYWCDKWSRDYSDCQQECYMEYANVDPPPGCRAPYDGEPIPLWCAECRKKAPGAFPGCNSMTLTNYCCKEATNGMLEAQIACRIWKEIKKRTKGRFFRFITDPLPFWHKV